MSDIAKNTVRVNIVGDASSLKRSLGEAGQATETAGTKMSAFAKVAVAALAVKALGAVKDFVGSSVTAFSDLNESLNALEVTYGDAADGIKKLGEEAAGNLGLSNAEFNSFAVSIGAFAKQIVGDSGDIVGTVDELTTRVSDFASVMNLEVADAALTFQSGLAGESEPLRKFGIDVSAAKVELYALENGIGDASGKLTEGEKVQARYGTIMEQTANVAGDFANTSEDLANKTRIFNAEMENSKALLGQSLAPALSEVVTVGRDALTMLDRISLTLGRMTGTVDQATQNVALFEMEFGRVPDTIADAMVIVEHSGVEFQSLADTMEMSKDELELLRGKSDEFFELYGLGVEDIANVRIGIQAQIWALEDAENATNEAGREAANFARIQEDFAPKVDVATDSVEEQTAALKANADLLREQTDPIFKLRQAQDRLAEAQRDATAALMEFGDNSTEYRDATWKLLEANVDLAGAIADVGESGGKTEAEWRTQLTNMGIFTATQVDDMIAELLSLNAIKFDDKTFNITGTYKTSGSIPVKGTPIPTAHGGIARASAEGTFIQAAEAGSDEAIIPLNDQGAKFMRDALEGKMGGSGGSSSVIYLTVNAGLGTNGKDVGEQIIEEIIRARRRGVDV